MTKNNKEKSSFWKKLGLGKNKTSASSMTSDKNSIKSKRLSTQQLQPPTQATAPQPPPPLPQPLPEQRAQKKEPAIMAPRVSLPKIKSQLSIHVDHHDISSTCNESVVTPTAHRKEEKESPIVYATEQPNITRNSDSSFVVVQSNDETPVPPILVVEEKEDDDDKKKLLETIEQLKIELENEKATVNVLQLQKQAVTKDLDYFELSVDELLTEKTDLLQQLEDEKIKNQQYLDDLNLSLEKQKATADNARGQSFAVDQTKLEFESVQEQWRQEQKDLISEIKTKDKTIRELRTKLNKFTDQVEALQKAMESLTKSHSEELSRLAAEKEKLTAWTLHTPSGSPRIQPESVIHPSTAEEEEEEEWSPRPSSVLPIPSSSSSAVAVVQQDDLDSQLRRLTKQKEKLQSTYSKIPLTGGGPQSRRRKEELEAMLDQVDSQLSKVKQKIRRS
ncbi:uncharacterized protein EV154DRAFT_578137 [Mucor mucedo]|uniref:uncharacterized protein n=1 Tax=Mucor mucedo TaxID=29922 RepID=UPI00221F6E35|nr:uncharacterized protein EV154DRAFT_578137 [Mucor mucedo]KAI7894545.1 hypothetical protein EV154DRAFT_578137 [Mucor mucedo]